MLGSAVSSRTPRDFHPNPHKGLAADPVISRYAKAAPPGNAYIAVGMQRALHSAMGLPNRSTSESWMPESAVDWPLATPDASEAHSTSQDDRHRACRSRARAAIRSAEDARLDGHAELAERVAEAFVERLGDLSRGAAPEKLRTSSLLASAIRDQRELADNERRATLVQQPPIELSSSFSNIRRRAIFPASCSASPAESPSRRRAARIGRADLPPASSCARLTRWTTALTGR